MDENFAIQLNGLYQDHMIAQHHQEQVEQQTNELLDEVARVLNPRRQFANWARSQEGQAWKRNQFKQQNERCARCNQPFNSLAAAEIHHVRSLHRVGKRANTLNNYRLLCTPCNRQLGTAFDENL
ncbi:MAG: HNH endonuclease signature motif containing protein [Cyanobacteria bacterium P01_G01_bin.54]